MRRLLIVVGIVFVAAAGAGAVALPLRAVSSTADASARGSVKIDRTRRLSTSDPKLADLVAGMHARPALSARLGAPPKGFHASPGYGALGRKWLYVTSAVPKPSGAIKTKVWWQGAMLAGALREKMHGSGDDLLGFTAYAITRSGSKRVVNGSSEIGGRFRHTVDDRPVAVQRAGVERTIKAFAHVTKSSVAFVGVMGRAPVLSITTDNPKALFRDNPLDNAYGASLPWAGRFVAVYDTRGRLLALSALSTKAQMGAGFPYSSRRPAWSSAGSLPAH